MFLLSRNSMRCFICGNPFEISDGKVYQFWLETMYNPLNSVLEVDMTLENQLPILLELGKKIAKETDIEAILVELAGTARAILGAERCSLFIYDREKDELWTKVAHGLSEPIRIPAEKGVAGHAKLSKDTQIVVDAYGDFRFNPDVDKKTGYVTKNIIAVPLTDIRGDVVGVFQALNKKNGIFGNIDAELLILIGSYASTVIENALLYKKIKESQNKIILKLSSAAEFKDEDTSRHTKRVGLYSAIMAAGFGMDEKRVELIKFTSPLHDAGKIGIPDHILHKPSKLDEAEFEHMKKHCQIGYDLLFDKDDDVLSTAGIIAKEHHEKWDGSGYPRGLRGEQISIEGRITAIADVFDALTSKRPYKEAWSFEKAKELITRERFKHFDANLVDIFFGSFHEVDKVYKENMDV